MKFWIRELVMRSVAFVLMTIAFVYPKKKNLILLGAHKGKRFSDNSAFLFKHILQNHPELRPVWLTNRRKVIRKVRRLGGEAYLRRSIKGIYLSLVAPIYLTSHNIKDVLMYVPYKKRPKHIYLHHGVPLRKGWFHVANAPKKSIQSTRNKIKASNFMVVPSHFAAEQQNKLLPIGLDKFKITGLPRNDVFFDPSFDKDQFKKEFGLDQFDHLVLYGPTWRPWEATRFFPFEDYDLETVTQFLKSTNMCLMMRPHHTDLNDTSNASFWESIQSHSHIKLLTHDVCPDVNHLCMISDALITDYSSMYYDYLIQDKPVIFLLYDYNRYNREIGFYPDFLNITHGRKPETQAAFLEALKEIKEGRDSFKEARNELKHTFYKHLDGNSSERIVTLIKELIEYHEN